MEPNEPKLLATLPRFWVVNKPPGWYSIPSRDPQSSVPILHDWVNAQLGRSWVVHRLDRDTSGVLLFARDEEGHREANLWFEKQKVQKDYRYLAQGVPSFPQFSSQEPIEGKPSRTLFEVLSKANGFFYGAARPQSGRRHQIRIHLEKSGFPIFGDVEHGGARDRQGPAGPVQAARVMLHAYRLKLPTGETFQASLPDDFTSLMAKVELKMVETREVLK